jgi:hypothetical protein
MSDKLWFVDQGYKATDKLKEPLNKLLKRGWFLSLPLGGLGEVRSMAHTSPLPTLSQREREKDCELKVVGQQHEFALPGGGSL